MMPTSRLVFPLRDPHQHLRFARREPERLERRRGRVEHDLLEPHQVHVPAVVDVEVEREALRAARHDERIAPHHAQAPSLAFALDAFVGPPFHCGRQGHSPGEEYDVEVLGQPEARRLRAHLHGSTGVEDDHARAIRRRRRHVARVARGRERRRRRCAEHHVRPQRLQREALLVGEILGRAIEHHGPPARVGAREQHDELVLDARKR
jgi:hypothetical protein